MRKIIAIIALAAAPVVVGCNQPPAPTGPQCRTIYGDTAYVGGNGCLIDPVSTCITRDGVEVAGPGPEFDACMAS